MYCEKVALIWFSAPGDKSNEVAPEFGGAQRPESKMLCSGENNA